MMLCLSYQVTSSYSVPFNQEVKNNNVEITLKRDVFNKTSTLGKLYINGELFLYTLEDVDRGLTKESTLLDIKKVKIPKKTCIPYGRYRVILSYSVKLKRYLPLILDVPGFRGIRMHKGSTEEYTSGCVCVGVDRTTNKLSKIKTAEEMLIEKLDSINRTEAIYITIEK